jgi:hypothetical protein
MQDIAVLGPTNQVRLGLRNINIIPDNNEGLDCVVGSRRLKPQIEKVKAALAKRRRHFLLLLFPVSHAQSALRRMKVGTSKSSSRIGDGEAGRAG